MTKIPVVFDKDSNLNDWNYGKFQGWMERVPRRPAGWDPISGDWREVRPAFWRVCIHGVNNAWREYKLPIKRGNTRSMVVVQACEHAGVPENIDVVKGQFGSFVDLLNT